MESRRFILALFLSLLVFFVYAKFFAPEPPQKPPVSEAVKQETAQQKPAPTPVKPESVAGKIQAAAVGRDIIIETDIVKAVVNTAGGVIKHWELKRYREADKTEAGIGALWKKVTGEAKREEKPKKELGNVQLLTTYEGVDRGEMVAPLTLMPLDKALDKLAYVEFRANHESIHLDKDNPSQTLILTYTGPSGIMIEKRLTFTKNDYKIDMTISTKGLDGYRLSLGTDFGLADKVSKDASGRVGLVALADGKTITEKLESIKGEVQHAGAVEWFSQADKYFTATILY